MHTHFPWSSRHNTPFILTECVSGDGTPSGVGEKRLSRRAWAGYRTRQTEIPGSHLGVQQKSQATLGHPVETSRGNPVPVRPIAPAAGAQALTSPQGEPGTTLSSVCTAPGRGPDLSVLRHGGAEAGGLTAQSGGQRRGCTERVLPQALPFRKRWSTNH